ncbi:hypothetical protein PMI41_00869 [Phyllobacterium sp. YR531]|nr:hypothetical protein PMI41_00869 [Phyllobacterium sp. YR531]
MPLSPHDGEIGIIGNQREILGVGTAINDKA